MQLGAFVNETFQAREGLEPALFPAVPSYLGHYHKPHTVRNTSIRYTGSPYQGMHPTAAPPFPFADYPASPSTAKNFTDAPGISAKCTTWILCTLREHRARSANFHTGMPEKVSGFRILPHPLFSWPGRAPGLTRRLEGAVSRSESGQQKELIVLDSDWQQVGATPLDLGPRHFNISLSTSELPTDVRAGDRWPTLLCLPSRALLDCFLVCATECGHDLDCRACWELDPHLPCSSSCLSRLCGLKLGCSGMVCLLMRNSKACLHRFVG